MIRWHAGAKARQGYANLGKQEDELDLFAIAALVEFWLVALGLVLLLVHPWIAGGVLVLALVIFVLALLAG
jgi:hypothetical protein